MNDHLPISVWPLIVDALIKFNDFFYFGEFVLLVYFNLKTLSNYFELYADFKIVQLFNLSTERGKNERKCELEKLYFQTQTFGWRFPRALGRKFKWYLLRNIIWCGLLCGHSFAKWPASQQSNQVPWIAYWFAQNDHSFSDWSLIVNGDFFRMVVFYLKVFALSN